MDSLSHLVGQLGPDARPVVGAEVAAGDFAFGQALDFGAVLNRNATARFPIADGGHPDTKALCQCRTTAIDQLSGGVYGVHFKIDFHG